jgi:hypothetical protein
MTGLRIAFDLDGVLADLEEPYTAARLALFGSSSVPPSTGSAESAEEAESVEEAGTDEDSRSKTSAPRVRGLTRGQQSGVWKRIARVPDFWTTLRPLEPRVVHGIQSLATRYRLHVFFVTQRPDTAGETTQRQTQRWLIQQGFELPAVIVMHGSRGRLAELLQLDVLVDDTPKHCVDVIAESKTRPMLVLRSGHAGTRSRAEGLGIQVVGSVREALIALRQRSVPRIRPSLWQRLNRRVGR